MVFLSMLGRAWKARSWVPGGKEWQQSRGGEWSEQERGVGSRRIGREHEKGIQGTTTGQETNYLASEKAGARRKSEEQEKV